MHEIQHKLSSKIINENQVIISEDLNVKGMIKNPNLAKRITDVAWSEFCKQLEYKAMWYGSLYHKISRWFASSQTCSNCGDINKELKLLSIRQWVCNNCGTIQQRDENAAKNILTQGLRELNIIRVQDTGGTIGIKTPVELVGYEDNETGNSNHEVRSLRL